MKRLILFAIIYFSTLSLIAQTTIEGTIQDESGIGMYASTIFLSNHRNIYAISGEEGEFSIQVPKDLSNDSLEIRYVSYQTIKMPLNEIDYSKAIVFKMTPDKRVLGEITITAKTPIAEEFSVKKLDPIQIYFNPLSKGDPLNAIQMLPASTDTEESASPSLRGSAPNRSVVVVEGVPVRNPVRYNQLNGLGSFSIFSTQILENQWVYASNPPLTYGNSTAGLIDIKLKETGGPDGIGLGVGLAHISAQVTKNFKENRGYITAYSNHHFSNLYTSINSGSTSDLNEFEASDLGIRYFQSLGKNTKLSVLNYSSIESYDVLFNLFSYEGNVLANQKRNFSVAKLSWGNYTDIFSVHGGVDLSTAEFNYGNYLSNTIRKESYSSLNYRKNKDLFVFQAGVSHKWSSDDFEEEIPDFYYAMSPQSPSSPSDTLLQQHDVQSYAYAKFYVSNFTFSAGIRRNFAIGEQEGFWSYQSSSKYQLDKSHSFLFSSGRYHNYNYPTSEQRNLQLLRSDQISLEYNYDTDNFDVSLSIFKKSENNDQALVNRFTEEISGVRLIKGVELAFSRKLGRRFILDLANSFVDVRVKFDETVHTASNDLNYLLKIGLSYFNNDVFNVGVSYVARPGTYYTDIVDSQFIESLDSYQPIFDKDINSSQYNNYRNLSFTANRMFNMDKNQSLVLFCVLNNVLNKKNQQAAKYNEDYRMKDFNYYSQRWVYLGGMINF